MILPSNYADYDYILQKILGITYSAEFKDNKIIITHTFPFQGDTLKVVYTVYDGGSWSAPNPPQDIDKLMVKWVDLVNELKDLSNTGFYD